MGRMTMNTFEIEKQTLAKCEKCGYEAASCFIIGGLCIQCRSRRLLLGQSHESATKRTIMARASRRFPKVPEYVIELLRGMAWDDKIREADLPDELRWKSKGSPTGKKQGARRRLPPKDVAK